MFWDKLETFKQKKMDDRWFWVMVDTAYSGGCGYLTGGASNALDRWFWAMVDTAYDNTRT